MVAVTFKDNYVIMTSLVRSCRRIFITRRANLIVLVTQFLGFDKWLLLFCHTTFSGATTNTGTSTINADSRSAIFKIWW